MTTFIYTLADAETGEIRYVGKTDTPDYRLKKHLRDRNHTRKTMWIKSLKSAPKLEIVAEVPLAEWIFWEQYWIAQFKAWGFDLVNGDNGGLGNGRLSDETKKKISASLAGIPNLILSLPIAQLSLAGAIVRTFVSRAEAEQQTGVSRSNIMRSIRRGGHAGGFRWLTIEAAS